ncbi:MAG: hypothetical protein ACRCVV_15255, partial [Shewanella sp.]
WLFELLLPFYQLKPVWPFSSGINKTFAPIELPLTGYFLLNAFIFLDTAVTTITRALSSLYKKILD